MKPPFGRASSRVAVLFTAACVVWLCSPSPKVTTAPGSTAPPAPSLTTAPCVAPCLRAVCRTASAAAAALHVTQCRLAPGNVSPFDPWRSSEAPDAACEATSVARAAQCTHPRLALPDTFRLTPVRGSPALAACHPGHDLVSEALLQSGAWERPLQDRIVRVLGRLRRASEAAAETLYRDALSSALASLRPVAGADVGERAPTALPAALRTTITAAARPTYVDVGANVGALAVPIAATAQCHAVAIEAMSTNAQLLHITACLRGLTPPHGLQPWARTTAQVIPRHPHATLELHHAAVSDGARAGCALSSRWDNIGDAWVRCGPHPQGSGYERRGSVRTTTLDAVLRRTAVAKPNSAAAALLPAVVDAAVATALSAAVQRAPGRATALRAAAYSAAPQLLAQLRRAHPEHLPNGSFHGRWSVAKLDIEGGEERALWGAQEWLHGPAPPCALWVEAWAGSNATRLAAFLRGSGYDYVAPDGGLVGDDEGFARLWAGVRHAVMLPFLHHGCPVRDLT